jgi:alpha-beta hydrolase superfamily lysophospholipase
VLAVVRVPVLALFGGEDTVVDTGVNRPRILECLASNGNSDVTVRTIEGVGHDLIRRRPAASLPWDGDESMAPIAEWAARRFHEVHE